MPTNNKTRKMEHTSRAKRESMTSQSRRKAPGTRLGTLLDWRGDSNGSGKTEGRHGQAIRDGR